MTENWSVETDDLECHRCGGPLHAMLRIPGGRGNRSEASPGLPTIRLVPLCGRCDRNEPTMQGLLAFFALHPHIRERNIDEFAALLHEALDRIPPSRVIDPEAFEREAEAWRNGEF
jgi:hypothetical protein